MFRSPPTWLRRSPASADTHVGAKPAKATPSLPILFLGRRLSLRSLARSVAPLPEVLQQPPPLAPSLQRRRRAADRRGDAAFPRRTGAPSPIRTPESQPGRKGAAIPAPFPSRRGLQTAALGRAASQAPGCSPPRLRPPSLNQSTRLTSLELCLRRGPRCASGTFQCFPMGRYGFPMGTDLPVLPYGQGWFPYGQVLSYSPPWARILARFSIGRASPVSLWARIFYVSPWAGMVSCGQVQSLV